MNPFSVLIQKAVKRDVWKLTNEAACQQWWSADKIRLLSEKRLKRLLIHSSRYVKYYRDVFDKINIDVESADISKVYNKLPVLNKSLLRDNFSILISSSEHAKNARHNASGGSTGKPVSFLSDQQIFTIMFARMNLMFMWAGWKPGEAVFYFWGGSENKSELNWVGKFKRFINQEYFFPVYFFDEKSFEKWWSEINKKKPKIIYAYPSVLGEFCSWLLEKGYEYKGLKGVFSSAEVLYDHQRSVIERAFGCKVFNQFGSREAPAIACECPEGNMHCFTDLNYLEFRDLPEGDGVKEIIVTPLFNYAQPLIRYNLMDWGRPISGSCSCGRGYPIMSMEIGRTNDLLTSNKGEKVYSGFFNRLLDGEGWIRNYQFRQKELTLMELLVEADDVNKHSIKLSQLQSNIFPVIREKLGCDMEIRIIGVDKIERTSSGKHRFVINETGL